MAGFSYVHLHKSVALQLALVLNDMSRHFDHDHGDKAVQILA